MPFVFSVVAVHILVFTTIIVINSWPFGGLCLLYDLPRPPPLQNHLYACEWEHAVFRQPSNQKPLTNQHEHLHVYTLVRSPNASKIFRIGFLEEASLNR
jgi:hypothetical protein